MNCDIARCRRRATHVARFRFGLDVAVCAWHGFDKRGRPRWRMSNLLDVEPIG